MLMPQHHLLLPAAAQIYAVKESLAIRSHRTGNDHLQQLSALQHKKYRQTAPATYRIATM